MYLSHLLFILFIICWLVTSTLREFLLALVLHICIIVFENLAGLSIVQVYIEETCGWFSSNLALFVMNLVVNLHAIIKSFVCLLNLDILVDFI